MQLRLIKESGETEDVSFSLAPEKLIFVTREKEDDGWSMFFHYESSAFSASAGFEVNDVVFGFNLTRKDLYGDVCFEPTDEKKFEEFLGEFGEIDGKTVMDDKEKKELLLGVILDLFDKA